MQLIIIFNDNHSINVFFDRIFKLYCQNGKQFHHQWYNNVKNLLQREKKIRVKRRKKKKETKNIN